MTIAAVSNAGVVNLDSGVSVVTVPFVASSTQGIVVHVGISSDSAVVLSVTDTNSNTYTKAASVVSRTEIDYSTNHYDKDPLFENTVEGEVWTTKSTGAVTSVVVTLTNGAKFAVEIESYSGLSGFGAAVASSEVQSGAPTISLVTTGANSFVSAGFSTRTGLSQAITTGTLRAQETSTALYKGIELAVADNTVAGLASTCTVAITPTNQEVLDGSTIAVPANYAVCAVELRS